MTTFLNQANTLEEKTLAFLLDSVNEINKVSAGGRTSFKDDENNGFFITMRHKQPVFAITQASKETHTLQLNESTLNDVQKALDDADLTLMTVDELKERISLVLSRKIQYIRMSPIRTSEDMERNKQYVQQLVEAGKLIDQYYDTATSKIVGRYGSSGSTQHLLSSN